MAAQKHKKIVGRNFLQFWMPINSIKTQLIKALSSTDCSISNGKLSQNPKTGFRELFLSENDFKSST